jgi:hypothetical protein
LKNRTLSPAVQSFINCTRGVAKSLFAHLDQPNSRASGRSQNERLWSGRFWRKAAIRPNVNVGEVPAEMVAPALRPLLG